VDRCVIAGVHLRERHGLPCELVKDQLPLLIHTGLLIHLQRCVFYRKVRALRLTHILEETWFLGKSWINSASCGR
jgi:hypothetical protein